VDDVEPIIIIIIIITFSIVRWRVGFWSFFAFFLSFFLSFFYSFSVSVSVSLSISLSLSLSFCAISRVQLLPEGECLDLFCLGGFFSFSLTYTHIHTRLPLLVRQANSSSKSSIM